MLRRKNMTSRAVSKLIPGRLRFGSVRQFITVIRNEGAFAALELAIRRAGAFFGNVTYNILLSITDRVYDWRTGVETGGVIQLSELSIPETAGRRYQATPLRTWRQLFRHLHVDFLKVTYVDLGCREGITLLFAAQRGFRRRAGSDL